MSFKIQVITAFVATDENGEEGVMAFLAANNQWMPLTCADEARIKSLYPMAEMISKQTGKPYRVLQFSQRNDVTEEVKEKYAGE